MIPVVINNPATMSCQWIFSLKKKTPATVTRKTDNPDQIILVIPIDE